MWKASSGSTCASSSPKQMKCVGLRSGSQQPVGHRRHWCWGTEQDGTEGSGCYGAAGRSALLLHLHPDAWCHPGALEADGCGCCVQDRHEPGKRRCVPCLLGLQAEMWGFHSLTYLVSIFFVMLYINGITFFFNAQPLNFSLILITVSAALWPEWEYEVFHCLTFFCC